MEAEFPKRNLLRPFWAVVLSLLGILVLFVAFQSLKNNIFPALSKPSRRQVPPVSSPPKAIVSQTQIPITTPNNDQIFQETESKYEKLRKSAVRSGRIIQKIAAADGQVSDFFELNKYEEYMKKEGTTYMDIERISIWFDNFPTESLTLGERQKIAYDTISSLRLQVKSGAMTMKQAGNVIYQNNDLKNVDEAWQSNAYIRVEYAKKDEPIFLDPNLEEIMWNMQSGDLSDIITGRKIGNGITKEAFYTVIKVNKREDKKYDTYHNFLDAQ